MLTKRKAQSTLEYALVIAAVIGALLAINAYMKKGVQGRLKESSDQIGRQFDASGAYTSAWEAKSSGNTTTLDMRTADTGDTTSSVTAAETVTRGETEKWGTEPAQVYGTGAK